MQRQNESSTDFSKDQTGLELMLDSLLSLCGDETREVNKQRERGRGAGGGRGQAEEGGGG